METNLKTTQLDEIASTAKNIREWVEDHSDPEQYTDVKNLELVRDFIHTLDLLETVLSRFEISVHLSKLALEQLEDPVRIGSLGWKFWQIDIEEFFASNLLELCYQLSNAWKGLQNFSDKNDAFRFLQMKYQKPSETLLARHMATHFNPKDFESHQIADKYSILRRPYRVQNGKLQKELPKETLPRVAKLIQDTIQEGVNYLNEFRKATIG
jgi:hypothetical protein